MFNKCYWLLADSQLYGLKSFIFSESTKCNACKGNVTMADVGYLKGSFCSADGIN